MNRRIIVAAMAAVVWLTSCQVAQKNVSLSMIEGEWNITEVNNSAVKTQPCPYIGFDLQDNRVYGNSGCNGFMGSFNFEGKEGKIDLGQMASTLMACPDMELEQNVLQALGAVKGFSFIDNEHFILCDKDKKPLLQLEKRFCIVPFSDIEGEWRIVTVLGEKIPAMPQAPFVNFDTENNRIFAFAGCNRLSGNCQGGEKINTLTFLDVVSTRMACPDMTTEQNVLAALAQVRSFGISLNGNLLLFSAGGNAVMELMRNK